MTSKSPASEINQAFKGARVCVTGGAGFIGSHLVEELLALGADVVIIDDLSTGYEANLKLFGDQISFIQGSILDDQSLQAATEGADFVFHLAAYVSAPGSVDEPELCHQINAEGTLKVMRAAARNGNTKVVFASSSAVYGQSHKPPLVESMLPDPLSPYAMTKMAGEHILNFAHHCYNLRSCSMRFFNVYGPRQTASSAYAAVISAFADALISGRQPRIDGDGLQTRDFIYVKDVVRALTHAAVANTSPPNSIFNVGTGQQTTIRQLYQTMAKICNSDLEPVHADARIGDVRHSVANVENAREVLGFESGYSITEGLGNTLDWYRQTRGEIG